MHIPLRIPVALAALLVPLLLSPASRADIIKGPHLQDIRQDGVTIIWEQDNASTGAVTINGQVYESSVNHTLHEVVITGLEPGQLYDYTVTGDATSDEGSFRTAPADPLAPFAFIVYGDNRSHHENHVLVVDALLAAEPFELLVQTGDMIASGEIAEDWQFFFDIEYPLLKYVPVYPTVGNHEEHEGYVPGHYTDYLAPPSAGSGTEAYYSYTYGNAAFIHLDGHVNVDGVIFGGYNDFDQAQQEWLLETLIGYADDSRIQHIFVANHEPPYSSSPGRSGSRAMRKLNPLFAHYGVEAVFSGHDHYLEAGVSEEGVRYFIMGGGGAPLYENSNEDSPGYKPPTALPWLDDGRTVHFARSVLGYTRFQIENGQVDVEIFDETNTSLYSVSWNSGDVDPGGQVDAGVPSQTDAALPPPPSTSPSDDKGCGCRSTDPGAGLTGLISVALLVLLSWIRRRRR